MLTQKDETKPAQAPAKRKTIDAFFKPKAASGKPARAENKRARTASTATKTAPAATDDPAATKEEDSEGGAVDLDELLKDISPEMRREYRLEFETIDPSWLQLLLREIKSPYFAKLKQFLKSEEQAGKQIFPPAIDVYSWSRYAPFSSVKVVILGQDPYHGPGQAHGLAFSVRPNVRIPPSLLNMYKALSIEFPDTFKKPNHGYLKGWAEQGVLMLNASLTVECHKANSHANKGWEQFTDAVIANLNKKTRNLVFMLWGSHAQKKGACVDARKHLVLKSVHPSPLSASRGFFEAGHFKKANEYLKRHGVKEIDWSYLPTS